MFDVLIDALKDSLMIFPFVALIYVLMEALENSRNKDRILRLLKGDFAPLVGSAFGVIPECGFPVMCAKLYDNGLIAVGTLFSVFISSSDEGIIILLSGGANVLDVVLLIAYKILFGCFFGLLFNVLSGNRTRARRNTEVGDCLECGERQEGNFHKYVLHPFMHTAKVFIYVLIVNVIFGTLFFIVGEDSLFGVFSGAEAFSPLIAPAFGLIPNCATSIALSQAYMQGFIPLCSLVSGLVSNAGMGLIVLFRKKENFKSNLILVVTLYLTGVISGYIAMTPMLF